MRGACGLEGRVAKDIRKDGVNNWAIDKPEKFKNSFKLEKKQGDPKRFINVH